MRADVRIAFVYLLMASLPVECLAQKVKVGYDKGTDFSKLKTYTWAEPEMPPTRPLLYASIVGSVDAELEAKGLVRTEKNGDLVLIPAGGMDFGLNQATAAPIIPTRGGPPAAIDATMWTGSNGFSNLMAPYVPQGTLVLTFVDRGSNKVIWSGTVSEKLDIEKKNKSLQLIDKAIVKLLKQFPPSKN